MNNNHNKVIDFNVHLGPAWLPTERRLHQEGQDSWKNYIQNLLKVMDDSAVEKSVIMLLDEEWINSGRLPELMNLSDKERLVFCAMLDYARAYEKDKILEDIAKCSSIGIAGLKIHPVLQRLTRKDYTCLGEVARKVEKEAMFVVVHAFSENSMITENNGLEIVAYLAEQANIPLVIAHSGGMDFSRAIFLAKEYPQIMLELSYFLKLGSILPMERLVAWGIEILGAERFLFASDFPYEYGTGVYKDIVMTLLEEIGVNSEEKAMIMGKNALSILNKSLFIKKLQKT